MKAAGDHWVVQEKKGRKTFSRGVWASAVTIDRIRAMFTAAGPLNEWLDLHVGPSTMPPENWGRD